MTFWDSSAAFAVLAGQVGADLLEPLLEDDPQVTLWWATTVELASAASRLWREGQIDATRLSDLFATIDQFVTEAAEIDPIDQVRRTAIRMLRAYSLRAADAMQLAAALVWMDHDPNGAGFVCVDKRLRDAAEREGFSVLPRGS